ncbi:UNVERIFIED_CONTAM: hypothetical protein FKN15_044180 [Acipenser sinensis]
MGAVHVEVEDTTTDHCSTSFKVLIVCPQFEGKPLLQRHSVGEEGPAVAIHFEKAQNQIQKFTEGHPGSLGIKACLGMEVLGSAFSGFMLLTHGLPTVMYFGRSNCHFHFENETYSEEFKLCEKYNTIEDCIFMELLFASGVQLAIGITIASYCCKAIQCCGAPRSMPVIVIQQPSEQVES